MTRKSIAIDMDKVLAGTLGVAIEAANTETKLGITMESLNGHKLNYMTLEHDGSVRDILRIPEFFRRLKVILHAQEVIEKLSKHYDIHIVTAVMDVPISFHDKYGWLLEYFPFLDPQHFIFCGRKNIAKTDYLIDDNPRQPQIFEGEPIIFTAAHNICLLYILPSPRD